MRWKKREALSADNSSRVSHLVMTIAAINIDNLLNCLLLIFIVNTIIAYTWRNHRVMSGSDNLNKNERIPGRRFARRMYLMRILGTLLCFFPILSVLLELHRPVWSVVLLCANAFLWPTVAFLRARNAKMPLQIEHQHLVFDAGAGGFWIALMAINPLPSVVIATILLSDRLSAGGVVFIC